MKKEQKKIISLIYEGNFYSREIKNELIKNKNY